MGTEGGLQPKNVWGAGENRGNFSPESFSDGDDAEINYLIRSRSIDTAANDPTSRDTAPKSFTRETLTTDNSVLEKLLGNTDELKLKTEVNLMPTFAVYSDPTAPTGSQINAIEEISNDIRDNNLNRVTLPQGIPMKAGGEIPGDIRNAEVIINDNDSWQKPAPVREQKQTKTSFLKRLFG